jgi:hypothetical protein
VITLEPKRALLLGADPIRRAAEGELTIEKAQLTLSLYTSCRLSA